MPGQSLARFLSSYQLCDFQKFDQILDSLNLLLNQIVSNNCGLI